ncbi:MAG: hypothetical protein AAGF11_21615 [Myxococcota bacterium]
MLDRATWWISPTLLALASCAQTPQPVSSSPPSTTPASSTADLTTEPPTTPSPDPEPPTSNAVPAIAVAPVDSPQEPNPYIAPPLRTAGDLTVHAPPREPDDAFGGGRLRSHIEGALSKGSPRVWVGPQVPGFVPLMEDSMELLLLDRVGDEFMALYRDPYGASSCGLGDEANCDYFVRLFDLAGNERWSVDPNALLSRATYLEIQDIRYADGMLYFNEACQSYSREVGGKCSALLAYDPAAGELRWRTRPLVSNGEILVHGDYIVTGYGFTNERDYVFVVRRRDGKIMQKVSVPKSAERFTLAEDGLLEVVIYPGTRLTYQMRGWDTAKPTLVKTRRKASTGRVTTGRS